MTSSKAANLYSRSWSCIRNTVRELSFDDGSRHYGCLPEDSSNPSPNGLLTMSQVQLSESTLGSFTSMTQISTMSCTQEGAGGVINSHTMHANLAVETQLLGQSLMSFTEFVSDFFLSSINKFSL